MAEIDPNRLGADLERQGFCTVPAFKSQEWCDTLRGRVESLLEDDELTVIPPDESPSYWELAEAGEAVVNQRGGGADEGMLDLFNIDLALPDMADLKTDETLQKIVEYSAREPVEPQVSNIYVNESVTGTRGLHADSYAEQFKAFVYITDVSDPAFGPFTYVPGSHRPSFAVQAVRGLVNKLRGRKVTDALLEHADDMHRFLADRGTLIVANQSGLHRGWPQEPGRKRMMATVSYAPVEAS